jgi:CheY-like chemotaxis protein
MISDTGMGIAEDKQQEIFEKFSQADVTATRRYGGTGLGLTICSELVSLMQGRIWVESPSEWAYSGGNGPGSTFHFTVWMGIEDGEDVSCHRKDSFMLPFSSVILLFRNQLRVRMLKKWFEESGLTVRVALNFQEAWEWLCKNGLTLLQTDGQSWPLVTSSGDVFDDADLLPPENRIFLYDEAQNALIPDFLRHRVGVFPNKPLSKAGVLTQLGSGPGLSLPADRVLPEIPTASGALGAVPVVLVAEDNFLNQKLINRLLEKKGYRVVIADNGSKALEAARSRPFDLILMDIQMPELDGVSATRILRQEGYTGPIIALTAHALKGDRESYLEAGMNDYLGKPVRQEELYRFLDRYLGPSSDG